MGKRQDILNQYRSGIADAASLDASQVKVGTAVPGAQGRTQYNLVPLHDTPERIDGDQVRRTLRLGIVAQIKVQQRKASDAEWEQLNDAWELIEPRIENLEKSNVNGKACRVEVVPPGVEWDAYDDGDSFAVVAQQIDIEYERQLGS